MDRAEKMMNYSYTRVYDAREVLLRDTDSRAGDNIDSTGASNAVVIVKSIGLAQRLH